MTFWKDNGVWAEADCKHICKFSFFIDFDVSWPVRYLLPVSHILEKMSKVLMQHVLIFACFLICTSNLRNIDVRYWWTKSSRVLRTSDFRITSLV